MVCAAQDLQFDRLDCSRFFHSLSALRAQEVGATDEASAVRSPRTPVEPRAFTDRQLYAVAELGYHYLRSGGYRLAEVLFRGLVVLDGSKGYFWLALGLTCDRLGDSQEAERCYIEAAHRSPEDCTPLVNLAELALERRDHRRASNLLIRARPKAERSLDTRMIAKIDALIRLGAMGGAR